jgi:two-component system cell cycle response regulator
MNMGQHGRQALRIAIAVLTVAVLAHGAHAITGVGDDGFFNDWVYNLAMLGGVVLCALRPVIVPTERAAWAAMAASLAVWWAGDLAWTFHFNHVADPPFPNYADLLYLASYPLCYVGLVMLLRARLRPVRASLWLDGAVSGLTLAAVVAALLFGPILNATDGKPLAVAVTLAYPVGDLLLLGSVGVALSITGWRPGRGWALIAVSLLLTAMGDVVYGYVANTGTYVEGSLLDTFWPASVLTMGIAAWQPLRRGAADDHGRAVLIPAAFALLAVAVLAYGWVAELPTLAAGLAVAGLLAAMARASLTFRENVLLLRRRHDEAHTDGLSGLANRRQLMVDLEDALIDRDRPQTLLFFDLDGFKAYNDAFGHSAGDALLTRLGQALMGATTGRGRAYRLGGDEFCTLLHGDLHPDEPVVARAVDALSVQGEGFYVTASYGIVQIPSEADSSEVALQLADERMYAHKDSRRATGRRQARDVLIQVLAEREPELRRHMADVADLAVSTGRRCGFDNEQLDVLARAAELHDIGKVAVPDDILNKPGPLDEVEWQIMKQHTLVGERILAAAPALRGVARLVRLSHERWDGAGYPDGLAGEDIPLGARIISVCDTYDAITSKRSYADARGHEEALAELRRCAGTQFDPRIVKAFCRANPHARERSTANAF